MDVGVYSIFTLRELTGSRPREVTATGTVKRLHGKTAYDSIIFSYLSDDGTPGVIEANFTFNSSNYELEGTRGRFTLTGHITQLIAGRLDAELWPDVKPRRVSERVVPRGGAERFARVCQLSGRSRALRRLRAVRPGADLVRPHRRWRSGGRRRRP